MHRGPLHDPFGPHLPGSEKIPFGDIDALARYFAALDGHVRTLLAEGVGLAELPERSDLPDFAAWDGYPTLHIQNANRAYLRIERDSFKD